MFSVIYNTDINTVHQQKTSSFFPSKNRVNKAVKAHWSAMHIVLYPNKIQH